MVGSVIVRVSPDELITAARHLSTVQVDVNAANMAASASTTRIAAAAHDEVSKSLASLFSTYGQQFHAQVAQAGVNGVQQFAQRLASAATTYSSAEAFNAGPLADFFAQFLATNVEWLVATFQTDPLLAIATVILSPVVVPFLFGVEFFVLLALAAGAGVGPHT